MVDVMVDVLADSHKPLLGAPTCGYVYYREGMAWLAPRPPPNGGLVTAVNPRPPEGINRPPGPYAPLVLVRAGGLTPVVVYFRLLRT